MIKNLIWDADGTLFDTYPAMMKAFRQALAAFHCSLPELELESMVKTSVSNSIVRLAHRFDLDETLLADAFNVRYSAIPKEVQGPFDGVRAVYQKIIDLGGSNHIVTHRRLQSTRDLLDLHELSAFFGEIAAGDQGFANKPDPAAFLYILEKCSLDPSQTAAVGDREIDIQAGQAAGLKTCWFRGVATQVSPDLMFSDYQELLDYLIQDEKAAD